MTACHASSLIELKARTELCRNPEMRSVRLEDAFEATERQIVRFCRGIRRGRYGKLGGREVSRPEW
jgi:hypothetical protein